MSHELVSVAELKEQLTSLDVESNGVLVVHTSFRKVRPVEGGPIGLIEALIAAVGPQGTIVMPSWADDDAHAFDPTVDPCKDLGIVADTFWQMPGVLRSDNPHSFAALGPHAAEITAQHPFDVPHGLNSPIGRAYEMDAQVLLLGVDHDSDTTIHLGEELAGVRYRCQKQLVALIDGVPTRISYAEIDHCCQNFVLLNDWLGAKQSLGTVGHASARLARSRDIVAVVTEHLAADETAFLHPYGVDDECDEARASIPA